MRLELDVTKVTILRDPGGADTIYADPAALRQAVGDVVSRDVWGDDLSLKIDVTQGRGEALCEALGLGDYGVIDVSG